MFFKIITDIKQFLLLCTTLSIVCKTSTTLTKMYQNFLLKSLMLFGNRLNERPPLPHPSLHVFSNVFRKIFVLV